MIKVIAIAMLLMLGGCATIAEWIGSPFLNLAGQDAQATMKWIDTQEKAGNLSPANVIRAKRCPQAVLELGEMRKQLAETVKEDGFKGVIYFGTIGKYGSGLKDEITDKLKEAARECISLVPVEKLIGIF